MKNKWKRVLSAALVCMMILALLPASALAAEDAETAETEIAAEEETVIPAEDADVTEPETPAEDAVIPEEDADVTEPEVPEEETILPEEGEEAAEPEVPAEEAAVEEETPLTETAAPTITGLTVADASAVLTNGSLIALVDADTELAGESFALTTSEAVTFQPESDPATGSLYVASASASQVTLALALGEDEDDYSISMSSTDGIVWSGSFSDTFALTMGGLAQALSTGNATLAAGAMVSTTTQAESEAYRLYCNQDAVNAQVILSPASTTTYTVDYMVSYDAAAPVSAYSWTVPAGSALTEPTMELLDSQTLDGWYLDSGYNTVATFGAAVTANTALYAKVTNAASGDFLTELRAGRAVTIDSMDDWNLFVQHSAEVDAGQLVTLAMDIDCDGATYTTLTFNGSFDGGNKTISNATFNADGGYSGLFKTIGPDQKVCNLVLEDITTKYASTYSGILAGSISGSEGHNALVQNIQVYNGTASGRSAGGIAGFIFWANVKYCYVENTTITGVANGGGIGGISYGQITQCGTVASPTALLSNGRGGIAGKNLEGGTITNSWCTYTQVVGTSTSASESNVLPNAQVNSSFSSIGLDATKWDIQSEALPVTNMAHCTYEF